MAALLSQKLAQPIFSISSRLLIATLCLTLLLPHCLQQAEGPDTNKPYAHPDYVPPLPPSPHPPPIPPPDGGIYLWVMNCRVDGGIMNAADAGRTGCDGVVYSGLGVPLNTATIPACENSAITAAGGTGRGDQFCACRYTIDVPAAERTRIGMEIETRYGTGTPPNHTALLGCGNCNSGSTGYNVRIDDPPNIRGRNGTLLPRSLQVKRPDETIIADTWDDFFRKDAPVTNSVSAASPALEYWTNFHRTPSRDFFQPTAQTVGNDCGSGNWDDNSSSLQASTGESDAIDNLRVDPGSSSLRACNTRRSLLCIIH